MPPRLHIAALLLVCAVCGISAKIGGYDTSPNTQYHIQTDEGPERYFKYQTVSGQYRKEKRLQDGTVVGTYGWVDANGYLRLRDYIADDKGYRVVRTKMVHVGVDRPIDNAVVSTTPKPVSKVVAPLSLSDFLKEKEYLKTTTPAPPSLGDYYSTPLVEINNNGFPSTTPAPYSTTTPAPQYIRPVTFRPYFNPNAISYDKKPYESSSASNNIPAYDGVSMTHNGFRYYLPRQYHEEATLPGDQRAGSFGYIDPFGIRRVIYYNSSPENGFLHRKNNRYVGFQATPYDPRF